MTPVELIDSNVEDRSLINPIHGMIIVESLSVYFLVINTYIYVCTTNLLMKDDEGVVAAQRQR